MLNKPMLLFVLVVAGCGFVPAKDKLNAFANQTSLEEWKSLLGEPNEVSSAPDGVAAIWTVDYTKNELVSRPVSWGGVFAGGYQAGGTTIQTYENVRHVCRTEVVSKPSTGLVVRVSQTGDYAGCNVHNSKLESFYDSYLKDGKKRTPVLGVVSTPATTSASVGPANDTTEYSGEKSSWVEAVAIANQCSNPKVSLKENKGVRDYFTVVCSNKTMEIQCEFTGKITNGPGGIPVAIVSGRPPQPACWQ